MEKIFYNAGLGDTFEEYKPQLTISHKQIRWEDYYYNNDRCYSALLEILLNVHNEFKVMTKLINSILDKLSLYRVFDENIDRVLRGKSSYNRSIDIVDFLKNR